MTEDPFVAHRRLLFTVAYEMPGSAADAEDVLQEAWLRWADVERSLVRDARAYLVRVVTRQALDRLRTLARRREDYVGEWLPEPLLTSPDVAEDVGLAESVSIDRRQARHRRVRWLTARSGGQSSVVDARTSISDPGNVDALPHDAGDPDVSPSRRLAERWRGRRRVEEL